MKTTRVTIVESTTYTYDIEVSESDRHWFALDRAIQQHQDNPHTNLVRGHDKVVITFEDLPPTNNRSTQ